MMDRHKIIDEQLRDSKTLWQRLRISVNCAKSLRRKIPIGLYVITLSVPDPSRSVGASSRRVSRSASCRMFLRAKHMMRRRLRWIGHGLLRLAAHAEEQVERAIKRHPVFTPSGEDRVRGILDIFAARDAHRVQDARQITHLLS